MRTLTLLVTLALAFSARAADDARILFLGTFHFANPGLDYAKNEVADVLSDEKQKEIEDVAERLRKFEPTKIVIEWPADQQQKLDEHYADYRAGKLKPERSEDVQLGFRLAQKLGHERLYAIDVPGDMDLNAVVKAAQEHDPEFLSAMQTFLQSYVGRQNKMQKENTVREILRWMNDPQFLADGHRLYVAMARVGGSGSYVGADQLGIWYTRNVRIFSNLARFTKAGDRILVIYGQGHVPILQQLARDMPGMKVVAANDFL